jgi:hypothetical protein
MIKREIFVPRPKAEVLPTDFEVAETRLTLEKGRGNG